ncbi:MFS transporter [Streptomyces sp. NPDC005648]|uniref:MFS transporter n=1 Tax=Streptomyces sp. NPDC005648 TaxID=3157044 RepID=UPI0033AD1044
MSGPRFGAYGRVMGQPLLRRLLPGLLVSALGDGMSLVAVAWLAMEIAPAGLEGVWTGLAVAAYSLPATIGAALFGRLVRGFAGARLVFVDAALRAVALGTIAVLAVAGTLSPSGYVALLAVSSLLHAWGSAGTYTLVAEVLPDEDRIAGNALLSTFTTAAVVVGPALAGAVTALAGPGWVIAADASSFAALAVCCRWVLWRQASGAGVTAGSEAVHPATEHRARATSTAAGGDPTGGAVSTETATGSAVATGTRPATGAGTAGGGWSTIVRQPRLFGLTAVTCVFFFLYGPVEVALPIHVATELHGSPGLLGVFWTVFGLGAVVGGLGAGLLGNRPLWAVVVVIIVGWGAALLPLGLSDAILPGLLGFTVGGLVYGPFTAICTALFQRVCPPAVLSRVLATRTALTTPSTALGMLLGGPLVSAVGGRRTLLASAVLTIALGLLVAAAVRPARPRRGATHRTQE